MPEKQLLDFINNEDLFHHVNKVLTKVNEAADEADEKLYSNVIDPFSAVFDALRQKITITEWLKQEKARQIQKTLQNAIGEDFHQHLLGSMEGWESLPTGGLIDVVNVKKKIIAEVKNKFNTTKGNHKVAIYDDFKKALSNKYKGFTAYYVEVIPKNPRPYNKEFTPPDNKTHRQRPANPKIRVIDGKSFYELASGDPDALNKLYNALPLVIASILDIDAITFIDKTAMELFNRAYAPALPNEIMPDENNMK